MCTLFKSRRGHILCKNVYETFVSILKQLYRSLRNVISMMLKFYIVSTLGVRRSQMELLRTESVKGLQ